MTFWVYQSYSICKKLLNSYPIFIKQKVIISMRIALSEVVERYQRNIYVAAYAIVRNSDDANDVVQDTFLQYYTKIRQFESEEHIKAWLLRGAINKATYLQGEASYLQKKAELETAEISLRTAYDAYEWMLKGVA